MHYVMCGGEPDDTSAMMQTLGVQRLADGGILELEGPWPLGPTMLGFTESDAAPVAPPAAQTKDVKAFAVEGLAAPGSGEAFVMAAHRVRDPEGFRPYAETIHDLLSRFGVRSLARGGTITPLAGDFAPERGVVLEFSSVAAVLDFYTSDVYAPLLARRLRTTEPRFVVIARSGAIAAADRQRAETYLLSRVPA